MTDLVQQLTAAVGGTYRIERELGGGGMSRVFLAEETALGRRVVVKVLPPEMAAGVNKDRFHREIQLAAKLQHPHVVPLLTAGAAGDLLYYVMPYVEGESLRARLGRQGELPVPEVVRILREVVDALAYAHRNGVVHRDIKPDNVLLSEGHALVADFGVAKAVTASSGASSLTSLGMALGTPAYMAPEQAAADPHVDHRADVYAVGALAYEMLCGRPPFTGPSPQAVMAAHVTQTPDPVTLHRPAVSEPLNGLVMRCLAKKAADRWQSAGELLPLLDAMTTPSGGTTPTGAQPLPAEKHAAAARRAHPLRVGTLFALVGLGALALVYGLVRLLALPNWVFVGALALLGAGLPVMLVTGHHERRRALLRTQGVPVTTPVTGLQRHFTWRRALWGGGLAFAALAVIAAGYTAMRGLGIGPLGTLVASGMFKNRDQIIVAEFDNRTADSTLAPSITEALRIDLGQSAVVRLVEATAIAGALQRMQRDPATRLDLGVAREIAEREGIKAVVAGEVAPLGSGYVLSARLVSAADGSTLVPLRETANDAAGIIAAVDRLSSRLRERIGESLRTIRASDPLDQVTTKSLDALRAYTRGLAAHNVGQFERAIAAYQEAIGLDSTFAMAYRKMGVALSNSGADRSRSSAAAARAYALRDRLPPIERYLATAYYYSEVNLDGPKAIEAYQSLLAVDPDNGTALNNLAMQLSIGGRKSEAETVLRHAIVASDSGVWQNFVNLADAQVALGELAAAESTVSAFARRQPTNPNAPLHRMMFTFLQGDYAASERYLDSLGVVAAGSPTWERRVAYTRAGFAVLHGRMAAAETEARRQQGVEEGSGQPAEALGAALGPAWIDVEYRGDPAAALRKVEAALARYPLARMSATDRPYDDLAGLFAAARRPDLAREVKRAWERDVPEPERRGPWRHRMDAHVAMAEGNYAEAAAAWRAFHDEANCGLCGLYDLGRVYDAGGQSDSALAVFERAVSVPDLDRVFTDAFSLAFILKRLGELYEQHAERQRALDSYARFVELWKDADPEFQPTVADVRKRMERLSTERSPS